MKNILASRFFSPKILYKISCTLIIFQQFSFLFFIHFELQLKTEVGANLGSFLFAVFECLLKTHPLVANQISDYQGSRLNNRFGTLETPAPQ